MRNEKQATMLKDLLSAATQFQHMLNRVKANGITTDLSDELYQQLSQLDPMLTMGHVKKGKVWTIPSPEQRRINELEARVKDLEGQLQPKPGKTKDKGAKA